MIKTIYIVNHTHTDIGYTDLQHRVAAQQVLHLDKAVELCHQTRNNPPGEQYKWTIESLWTLDEYIKNKSDSEVDTLIKMIRDGNIELTGFYHQSLTQLCSLNALLEEFQYGRGFSEKHGVKINTLMLNDIGGISWNIPQIMRLYDMKYFVLGTGGWRVLTPIAQLPHIFYYKGPDGSKVVIQQLGLGYHVKADEIKQLYAQYGFGAIYLLFPFVETFKSDGEKADLARKGDKPLYELLARLEKDGYPYDAMLLQLGMDNKGPQEDIIRIVKEWNSSHDDVKLRLASTTDFFSYLEGQYAESIPELNGELTCSWTEHVLTQGSGCGMVKAAERNLLLAESMQTVSDKPIQNYMERRKTVYSNVNLFNDHTFGLSMWGWQEAQRNTGTLHFDGTVHDYARNSWDKKYSYAYSAWTDSRKMVEEQEKRSLISYYSPGHLTVYNPLPFKRNGLVEFYAREYPGIKLMLDGTGIYPDREPLNGVFALYSFYLPEIGPGGCRTFAIESTEHQVEKTPFEIYEDNQLIRIEYDQYEITVSQASGCISSLKFDDVEYVDSTGGNGLNDFAYFNVENTSEGSDKMGLYDNVVFNKYPLQDTQINITHVGHYILKLQVLRSICKDNRIIKIGTEIKLVANESKIYLKNRIRKINLEEKEAAYFVFPLNVSEEWELHTNQQGYLHDFLNEKLPGAAHHNIGFQDYVIMKDAEHGMIMTSLEATVLSVGSEKYYNSRIPYEKDKKGWVYFYCFNNLWNTNCALEQQGILEFDFVIEPISSDSLKDELSNLNREAQKALLPLKSMTHVNRQTEQGGFEIDNQHVDYGFSSDSENTQIRLYLINMSRKKQNVSVTWKGKQVDLELNPSEFRFL